jgi:hypothetical protein
MALKTFSALLSDGTRISVSAASGQAAIKKAKAEIADREGVTVRSVVTSIPVSGK